MTVASTTTNAVSHRYPFTARPLTTTITITAAWLVCAVCAQADSMQADTTQTSSHPLMSVLDGKSFSGELGGPGITPGRKDIVVFQDGMFVSKECERRCGYTDGPYWVRSDGDGVQFKAETPCLKADATIVWTGTVKDDEIEGTFTWTSERWYWTVEKEFSFKGTLMEPDVSAAEQVDE